MVVKRVSYRGSGLVHGPENRRKQTPCLCLQFAHCRLPACIFSAVSSALKVSEIAEWWSL